MAPQREVAAAWPPPSDVRASGRQGTPEAGGGAGADRAPPVASLAQLPRRADSCGSRFCGHPAGLIHTRRPHFFPLNNLRLFKESKISERWLDVIQFQTQYRRDVKLRQN